MRFFHVWTKWRWTQVQLGFAASKWHLFISIVQPNSKPTKSTTQSQNYIISLIRGIQRQLRVYLCHMWKVVCSWRQLLASAVAARGNLREGPAVQVTLVIRKPSYFHLCACVSNSAESLLPLVPTPALDTHIRAGNAVLAPWAPMPSWVPTRVAGGLASHHSAPGPPRHADVDTGVTSSESTVPHAKCASGVIWFKPFRWVKWEQSGEGHQEALLTRGWLEKHHSDQEGADKSKYGTVQKKCGKGKGGKKINAYEVVSVAFY